MAEKSKKKFRLVDAILGTVCLTLVCESVIPTASIGNTQYFWWIFLLIGFCLPYGMISAELGTTYPSEGGMYDWVKRAFGPKWAGRVAWNYWINFPLWISSLGVAVTQIVAGAFGIVLPVWALVVMQLAYIWLVTFLSTQRIGESKYVVNLGTFFKALILLGIGGLGIYALVKNNGQSANPITGLKDLIPIWNVSGDLVGLTGVEKFHYIMGEFAFISIILFNFMGFEVVGTWTDDMDNPKKDIPKALIFGGLLMALFYILPAAGFNIALPSDPELVWADGAEVFITVLKSLFTTVGLGAVAIKVLAIIFGLMLVYTFIANIASWSFGVNAVAKYAADDGSMPKAFSKTNEEGVPYMGAIINGIVASLISIAGIIAAQKSESFSDSFGLFFKLSWITLLIGYAPMFLAFIKLRRVDADKKRPYRAPLLPGLAIIPFVLLVLGIIFTLFYDFSVEAILDYAPLFLGVVVSFVFEEVLVLRIGRGHDVTITSLIFGALSGYLAYLTSGVMRYLFVAVTVAFVLVILYNYLVVAPAKKSKKVEE